MSSLKNVIRFTINKMGYDLRRRRDSPALTWLGLPLRKIKLVVDVGANRGQFAKRALKAFPGARIHCYEPLPGPYAELRKWAITQANVVTHQMALGDRNGTGLFLMHVDHDYSSSLLDATAECKLLYPKTTRQTTIEVPISTLDDEFPTPMGDGVLLKLDVQGFEDRVIRGGAEFLKQVDVVITEYSVVPLYEQQAKFSEICQALNSSDLIYAGNFDQVHSEYGEVLYLDAVFIRRSKIMQEMIKVSA